MRERARCVDKRKREPSLSYSQPSLLVPRSRVGRACFLFASLCVRAYVFACVCPSSQASSHSGCHGHWEARPAVCLLFGLMMRATHSDASSRCLGGRDLSSPFFPAAPSVFSGRCLGLTPRVSPY